MNHYNAFKKFVQDLMSCVCSIKQIILFLVKGGVSVDMLQKKL